MISTARAVPSNVIYFIAYEVSVPEPAKSVGLVWKYSFPFLLAAGYTQKK